MKRVLAILLVAFAGSAFAAEALPVDDSPDAVAKNLLTLGLGQQVVLTDADIAQISIGNPRVVQAKLTPDHGQILLTAQAAGSTDLIIWKRSGERTTRPVWVIGGSVKEHALELGALLSGIDNIRIRQVGERILIEGEALRQDDLNRISQAALLYPNITNHVEMAENIQPLLVESLNQKLRELGYLSVKAEALARKIYLNGEFSSVADHEKALKVIQTVYAGVIDLTRVGSEAQPLIRLDLTLLELNRTRLKHLGIQWQQALEATGKLQVGTPDGNFSLTTDFAGTLNALEKKGWGRILTQPSLLCRSGEEATFLAGGEIPIRLISERAANVIFKPYGISLRFLPRRTETGAVALRVETEISTLDGSNSVEGIPAFLTRKLTSVVTLTSGKQLILGGLTDRNDLKAVDRLPLLADIPVLGELFKSRQFRDGSTDLVIFIRPLLVTGEPVDEQPAVMAQQQRYQEAQSWFQTQRKD